MEANNPVDKQLNLNNKKTMNKTNILRALVGTVAIVSTISATINLDALPESWQTIAGTVLVALLGLKEVVVVIGDVLDDGKRNNSFKP